MSRVQFNLLPDVKLDYDRSKAAEKRVLSMAALASGVLFGIFLLLFLSVNGIQRKMMSDADKNITTLSQQIKNLPNIEKILTVQNQLVSLPSLHQKKHITSRLFDYLPQLTPPNAGITKLTMSTGNDTMTVTGTADSVQTVNTFVDTIKAATYTTSTSKTAVKAFSNVVLGSISRDNKGSSYTINSNFDPVLFQNGQTVTLTVPQGLSTQSLNPTLFTGQNTNPGGQ